MINIRNLMIGDVVKMKGYPYWLHISQITKDWIYVEESFGGGKIWKQEASIDLENIEPIPLTHTILKSALEYENETEDGRYYSIDNSTVWGILDKKKFYLNFNGQQDMIEIKYVHELQHALRLIGKEELADNIKI